MVSRVLGMFGDVAGCLEMLGDAWGCLGMFDGDSR